MTMRITGQNWLQRMSGRSKPSVCVGEEPEPDAEEDQADDDARDAAAVAVVASLAAAQLGRRRGRRRRWARRRAGRRLGVAAGGRGRVRSGRRMRVVGSGSVRRWSSIGASGRCRGRPRHRSPRPPRIGRPAAVAGAIAGQTTATRWRRQRGGYGGDRRLRRLGVLLAPRGRARGQGRHAVRRAVRFALPRRRRRAAGRVPAAPRPAAHDPAAQDQLPGQRLGDALARGQGGHLAVRGRARSSSRSSPATSSCATSSSTGRAAAPTRSTTARS